MEETDKTELTTLVVCICAELEHIGCKEIGILIDQKDHAIRLDYFTKNADYYHVLVTKRIDQDWNDQLHVEVRLTRNFNGDEMIPISSLTINDTLTVITQWDNSTAVRVVHRVSGSINCKTPCDANTASELVTYIYEISKLD